MLSWGVLADLENSVLTYIRVVDQITSWAGKVFAWCIMIMTFGTAYEVYVRYLLRDPTSWAFDLSYIMYGTLFMMAGAYTLSRGGHVRGDVLYRLWKPKTQARLEFILYFFFFFPGILALIYAGGDYALESWSYNNGMGEVAISSPAGVPVSQFKTVIPVAGMLLFIQGLAQICRCIICMRTGEWPPHTEDVEEVETALLHQKMDDEEIKKELGLAQGDTK
jgi:TRAP-type mannitol/chloroaromatic compound transport system permease small subunit